jgi:cell fate regulator YaaT (PSP1 superfamily)
MVALPQHGKKSGGCGGCGDEGGHCGAGLERIYPTTAVRYGAMNYIGEFTYKPGSTFRCGGKVVIQTDRGIELGEQVSLFCNGCSSQVTREQIKQYVQNSGPEFYRLNAGRIIREATPDDVNDHQHLNAHIAEDLDRCALLAAQLNLPIKIVTCEHLLGGERIVFYFRSEDRIDFRELVRLLASHYRTRIEMRQVGARDEARLVADYEICGRECCCKNFLKKLRPVSMKMAKVQKATLDPSKVSGRCGRLRCCLRYEHEGYEALMKKLPRAGSRVRTEFGPGVVVDRQILTQLVMVHMDDNRQIVVPVEEILEFDLPALPPGAAAEGPPRDRADQRPERGGDRRSGGPQMRQGPRPDGPRPEPARESRRSDAPGGDGAGEAATAEIPGAREPRDGDGRRGRSRRRGRGGQGADGERRGPGPREGAPNEPPQPPHADAPPVDATEAAAESMDSGAEGPGDAAIPGGNQRLTPAQRRRRRRRRGGHDRTEGRPGPAAGEDGPRPDTPHGGGGPTASESNDSA